MSAILRFAGAGGNPAVESRVLFARRCAQMSHLGIVQERLYVLVCIALSMLIVRWVERPMRHHLRELLCSPSQVRGRESMTSA